MVIFDLLALIVLGLIVWGVWALVQWGRGRVDSNRKALVASEAEREDLERVLNKAERVLRRIANGSGNPELEAQIGLDEINNYLEGDN